MNNRWLVTCCEASNVAHFPKKGQVSWIRREKNRNILSLWSHSSGNQPQKERGQQMAPFRSTQLAFVCLTLFLGCAFRDSCCLEPLGLEYQ